MVAAPACPRRCLAMSFAGPPTLRALLCRTARHRPQWMARQTQYRVFVRRTDRINPPAFREGSEIISLYVAPMRSAAVQTWLNLDLRRHGGRMAANRVALRNGAKTATGNGPLDHRTLCPSAAFHPQCSRTTGKPSPEQWHIYGFIFLRFCSKSSTSMPSSVNSSVRYSCFMLFTFFMATDPRGPLSSKYDYIQIPLTWNCSSNICLNVYQL